MNEKSVLRYCGVCGRVTSHIVKEDQEAYEVHTCKRCGVTLRDEVMEEEKPIVLDLTDRMILLLARL